jgi:signal transduction histidine kinase
MPAAGGVRLTVSDDGRGLDPDAAPGVGIAAMRERAAELGGSVEVEGGPDGTRVVMVLP